MRMFHIDCILIKKYLARYEYAYQNKGGKNALILFPGKIMNQDQSVSEAIPPLPIYESSQHMSRSINLNDLIKLHRFRQKYEIVDKFFNNSYIAIENRLQPIQSYYYSELFKSYLQDLALVYFKDIEFNQTVRLQFILRRLNFTLNGQNFDFKQFLHDNKFYDEAMDLFSDEYLDQLSNTQNKKSVLNLRNSVTLCFLIDAIHSYGFSFDQKQELLEKINQTYRSIVQNINYEENFTQNDQSQESHQCFLKNISSNSGEHSPYQSLSQSGYFSQDFTIWFDDMIYQQQIDLKLIETEIQIKYFTNKIEDTQTDEVNKLNHRYIIQINKEYTEKLNELRKLNSQNRKIMKVIKKNIKIELMTGIKCIALHDSTDLFQCFGQIHPNNTLLQQKQHKLQKVIDIEYIENQLLKMINKLKLRLIADAIQKVFSIQKDERKDSQGNDLLFSVSFQHGLGIQQAVFNQSDFILLNQIREESTLTSYLTPMKSTYSYISHNIYTFIKLFQKEFPYNKETNNNQEVINTIRNKFKKCVYLEENDIQSQFQEEFKLCHNCKILCHQLFLKQCKKKHKQYRQEQSDGSDDSLYTEKNYRKTMSPHFIQCQKYYCIYCIKNQFNGKIFNDKGWCPACLHNCHCNTCLRQKILKKYVELYIQIGGNKDNIKTQKEIINKMRVKNQIRESKESADDQSKNGTQIQQRIYESVIKKEIMKGYSADQIGLSLRHQQQLIQLIFKRQQVKLQHITMQKELFRQKIDFFNSGFNYAEIDQENKRIREQQEAQEEKQKQLIRKKIKKRQQKKILQSNGKKRKSRKVRRQQQIYYDFYRDQVDSELESSSFHLSKPLSNIEQRKAREKKYEPEYTF